MVTKADFDRSMAEIRSQMLEMTENQRNTDLRLQQEAEHTNLRFAAAEEQIRLRESQLPDPQALQSMLQQVLGSQDRLLNILRDEMNTQLQSHLTNLRTELQSGKQASPSIPNENTLSQFRQPHIPDPVHTSSEDKDFLRRETRFQLPRADCPSFTGMNLTEWLRKCNSFFELHQVPLAYRTQLATMQFHELASEWYDGYLIDHEPPDWKELVRLVNSRFKRISSKNTLEELKDLNQGVV
jgi:hypothetical protein